MHLFEEIARIIVTGAICGVFVVLFLKLWEKACRTERQIGQESGQLHITPKLPQEHDERLG